MLLSDNLIKHPGRALRIIASKIWSKPTIMVRYNVSYTQALTLLLGFSHVGNGTAGMNAVEDNQLKMLAPGPISIGADARRSSTGHFFPSRHRSQYASSIIIFIARA
jgi:hypothetical protein